MCRDFEVNGFKQWFNIMHVMLKVRREGDPWSFDPSPLFTCNKGNEGKVKGEA
jgi:hypothetical protein